MMIRDEMDAIREKAKIENSELEKELSEIQEKFILGQELVESAASLCQKADDIFIDCYQRTIGALDVCSDEDLRRRLSNLSFRIWNCVGERGFAE